MASVKVPVVVKLTKSDMAEAWDTVWSLLPEGTCDLAVYHYDDGPAEADGFSAHKEPAKFGAKTVIRSTGEEVYGYGLSPGAALWHLVHTLMRHPSLSRPGGKR